jgi:Icc-related predicted phosphoesterase
LGKPVILVFGNGDDDWYDYPFGVRKHKAKKSRRKFLKGLKNLHDITYGIKKIRNITFVGFGGYMDIDAYFDRKNWKEKDEEVYVLRATRREESRKYLSQNLRKTSGERIFIYHYPPKGVFDIIKSGKDNPMNGKSAGIGFFKDAILKYKPRLVLCGHMHEYCGGKRVGRTIVVNPGDAEEDNFAIVDYPQEGNIKVKLIKS